MLGMSGLFFHFCFIFDGNGWMDDLRFYVLLNSTSVISGRCLDDNERLCAMELFLRLRRFHLKFLMENPGSK